VTAAVAAAALLLMVLFLSIAADAAVPVKGVLLSCAQPAERTWLVMHTAAAARLRLLLRPPLLLLLSLVLLLCWLLLSLTALQLLPF
jgi:hypothetical protein